MSTLKGVFPDPKPIRRKNFIYENVKSLRRMEQCFQTNKEIDELNKMHLRKSDRNVDKYQNIAPRVNTGFRDKRPDTSVAELNNVNNTNEQSEIINRKCSAPILNKNFGPSKKSANTDKYENVTVKQKRKDKRTLNKCPQKLKTRGSSDPNLQHKLEDSYNEAKLQIKYKSQAIQTMDTKEIDDIYSEGSIRYPTKKSDYPNGTITRTEKYKDAPDASDEVRSPPSDRGDINIPDDLKLDNDHDGPELINHRNDTDFVKLNKERTSVASRMAAHVNSTGALPTNYRKGVVPKYIRDRKEAYEKEQKEKAESYDPDCPEGHITLPDNERKETLRMLKKNYQDYVSELNMMPIKTDTLRAQRRKMEIEKQLTKLEEGIKVFSRPKVYVKVNA